MMRFMMTHLFLTFTCKAEFRSAANPAFHVGISGQWMVALAIMHVKP